MNLPIDASIDGAQATLLEKIGLGGPKIIARFAPPKGLAMRDDLKPPLVEKISGASTVSYGLSLQSNMKNPG